MCAPTAASPVYELGRVADPLLALEDLGQVGLLRGGSEGDVSAAVVSERLGVGLPDLDVRRDQLLHRGLEVVVADHPAGDPRGSGPHPALVDDDHLLAGLREMPRGGESVRTPAPMTRYGARAGTVSVNAPGLPALEHRRLPVPADDLRALDPGPELGLGELRVRRLQPDPV